MSSPFFDFSEPEQFDWQKQYGDLVRNNYVPKTTGDEGGFLDFLSHFGDETEKELKDTGGIGVVPKGYDLLASLLPGTPKAAQAKLTPDQSNAQAPTIGSNIGPAIFAPPEEANTDISRAVKGIFGPLGQNEAFQRVGAEAVKSGIDLARDPSMYLMTPEAIGAKGAALAGAVLSPQMISSLGETAGQALSNVDQGKAFGEENQKLLGEALPIAAMLGHSLPGQASELAHAIPEIPLGGGYTSRSPITFDAPGGMSALKWHLPLEYNANPGMNLGNLKLRGESSEPGSAAQPKDDFIGSLISEAQNDPLIKKVDELKQLGVLTNIFSNPETIRAYHGTGNRDWAVGEQPFSSRMVADDNLWGGGQYNSSRSSESERAYALEGSKPGLLDTKITTAKPFDLEAPKPRDFDIRGRAIIADAIRGAENPLQAKTYQELYEKFKAAPTTREAHEILTDVLDRKTPTNESSPDLSMGRSIGERIPFQERQGFADPKERTNKILRELGYDAIKQRGFGHEHDVTIPFSRHQLETERVTPLEKLENRSAESLTRDLELLGDQKADQALRSNILAELNSRHHAAGGHIIENASVLNDPELGPKYIDDLKTQMADLKTQHEALPKDISGLSFKEQAKVAQRANKLGTQLDALEAILRNSENYLKDIPGNKLISQTLKNPPTRPADFAKLTPEEEALMREPLGESGKALPVKGPKPINIPTLAEKYLPFKFSADPGANLGNIKANPEFGKELPPAQKFAQSQERKYGKDWETKQTPEEATFYRKLQEIPDKVKFEKPGEGASSQEFNDQILHPEASKLERTIKRKDGSKMVLKEVEGLVQVEHYSKDGELVKATRGTSLDDQVPVEILDSSKPFNYSEDPEIRKLQEGILAAPVKEAEVPESIPSKGISEIPPEGKTIKKNFQVFLDDGSKHTVKAESLEAAQAKAEEILASRGSEKKVTQVKEKLSSLETAASIPASQRDIKQLGEYGKAQDLEDIKSGKIQERLTVQEQKLREKAQIAELQDQLKVEGQKAKAGDLEAKLREKAIEQELKDKLKVEAQWQKLQERKAASKVRQAQFNNQPGPSMDKVANFLDKLSGGLKSSVMSTGVPKTGINPHGFSTLGRSFTTASYTTPMDNPLSAAGKTLKYMFMPSEAQKFLDTNKLAAQKYDSIQKGFGAPTEYDQPKNILGQGHFKLFAEPLFHKIIPALKLEKAQMMEAYYKKRGLSPGEAATRAVDDANTAFGGLKSWNQSRFNRIALFAPDWLETNVKLATGTAKALASPTSPVGRMYRSYLGNALALYAIKNGIQYGLSGTLNTSNTLGHKEDIDIGKEGKKDLYVRPEGTAVDAYRIPLEIAETLGKVYETGDSKYLSKIQQIMENRLSPLKVFANIALNRDFKGDPLYGLDKFGKPIPMFSDQTSKSGKNIPSTTSRIANELEGVLPQPLTGLEKLIQGDIGPVEFGAKAAGLPLNASSYKIENMGKKKTGGRGGINYKSLYQF
jgi:hypothetical protein